MGGNRRAQPSEKRWGPIGRHPHTRKPQPRSPSNPRPPSLHASSSSLRTSSCPGGGSLDLALRAAICWRRPGGVWKRPGRNERVVGGVEYLIHASDAERAAGSECQLTLNDLPNPPAQSMLPSSCAPRYPRLLHCLRQDTL